MEILQTIWTALTTENFNAIKIISVPMTILEATVTTLLFTSILNIDSTKQQKFTYIMIFSIVAIISMLFIPVPFNTFFNVIACPVLVYFIFRTNVLKAILSEIIQYVAFILIGSFLINIYLLSFNISANMALVIPIHKISYSLLLYLFIFLISTFCKYCNININIFNDLGKKNSLILLGNFIIGIIALAVQSYLATAYADVLSLSSSITSILVLLLYFFISIYSLSRTNKLEKATQDLEEEKLYNKTLTILYDNIRGFKHDFNNIVQAIGGYISTNDMNGLKDYYSDLLNDCKKVNNLAVLNPELISNPAVYSLLTSKYHKAEELGITMNFDIFIDLQALNIKTYDLTRILGILLDNAIEASSKCNEKKINISIRKDNKVNRQLFIIENTYLNKDVNTDRIFEKGYTSKTEDDGKNHGLGLWEVRQILKKNNNLNLFTTKDDKFFKQQLEIYF